MRSPLFVVIPSYDRVELLLRTLSSLSQCIQPDSYCGTVVIENGSRSSALERAVQNVDPRLKASYQHTAIPNKSAALNQVIVDVPSDGFVVFFDDDVIVHPHALVAYAKAAEAHPDAAYFGGPVFPDFSEGLPPVWLRQYLPASVMGWSLGGKSGPVSNVNFMGANWAARAQELVRAGLFDPSVGPGSASGARGQETRMQNRLVAQGALGVYVADAIVWHHVPSDRCSADWAISRASAHSKSRSMLLAEKEPAHLALTVFRSFVAILPVSLALLVLGPFVSAHKKFWLRFRLHTLLGAISGAKLLMRSGAGKTNQA